MTVDRLILHSDLNNFYASVECALDPSLKDVPVAVAGNPEKRHGVVLAKNAVAKKAGVKTGDVIFVAKQKCPGIRFVRPHFDLYMKYSKAVFGIYTRFTPLVEPFGPDECWLDMTGSTKLFGSGEEIARRIADEVKKTVSLTVSVGISFTKPFAKLCSDLALPDGYFKADKSEFKEKLWPLEIGKLLMVGGKTQKKLNAMGVFTVGDLALKDEAALERELGKMGVKLKSYALGKDDEQVRRYDVEREKESVGHGMTAVRDIKDEHELYTVICYLCEKISARMIKYGLKGECVHVDLRSAFLKSVSKQKKLPRPVFAASDISETAFMLAKELTEKNFVPLRTVTVSVSALSDMSKGVQISFFDDKDRKRENLELALDKIRRKYGKDTVRRASLIACDFIYDKDDNEDFLPFQR